MVKIVYSELQPFLTDPPMWQMDEQTSNGIYGSAFCICCRMLTTLCPLSHILSLLILLTILISNMHCSFCFVDRFSIQLSSLYDVIQNTQPEYTKMVFIPLYDMLLLLLIS